MREKLLVLSTILATGALASGCGSSSSSSGGSNSGLSYSAFSNDANKICMDGDTAIKALGSIHATSLPAAAGPFSKVGNVISTTITQLQGLQGPPALNSARDTYVADLRQFDAGIRGIIGAAKANDLAGYKSEVMALSAVKAKDKADGSKLGAPACAS